MAAGFSELENPSNSCLHFFTTGGADPLTLRSLIQNSISPTEMKEASTSLDAMHDIVVPDPVSWWPLATGWYVMLALIVSGLIYFLYRSLRLWQFNAYRREALKELETADQPANISELLRRTALAVAPRSTIASQQESSWPRWLESTCPASMSERVATQLTYGPYRVTSTDEDVLELKEYASIWIKQHQIPLSDKLANSAHS